MTEIRQRGDIRTQWQSQILHSCPHKWWIHKNEYKRVQMCCIKAVLALMKTSMIFQKFLEQKYGQHSRHQLFRTVLFMTCHLILWNFQMFSLTGIWKWLCIFSAFPGITGIGWNHALIHCIRIFSNNFAIYRHSNSCRIIIATLYMKNTMRDAFSHQVINFFSSHDLHQ